MPPFFSANFFAQAHNDYLQLAAEGGLLVTGPAAVCFLVFVRDVRRSLRAHRGSTTWWLRAGAVSALVAIGFQEMVEFSLQMPGNAALFTVVCAVALHRPAPGRPREPVPPESRPPGPRRLEIVSRSRSMTRHDVAVDDQGTLA